MKISGLNLKTPIVSTLFAAVSLFSFKGVAIGSGGVTVIPDGSLFVQIANFLIIIWALNVILYKPIRKILIQRKEKIVSLEQNIEFIDEPTGLFSRSIPVEKNGGRLYCSQCEFRIRCHGGPPIRGLIRTHSSIMSISKRGFIPYYEEIEDILTQDSSKFTWLLNPISLTCSIPLS